MPNRRRPRLHEYCDLADLDTGDYFQVVVGEMSIESPKFLKVWMTIRESDCLALNWETKQVVDMAPDTAVYMVPPPRKFA